MNEDREIPGAPDAFAPDAFAPDAFAPDAFAPDAFARDAFVHEAFAHRVAARLRTPARLDPSFEMRVMAEVQSLANDMEGRAQASTALSQGRRPWWRRRYAFVLTPVSIAAGVVGVVAAVVLSTLAITHPARSGATPTQSASAPSAAPTAGVLQTSDTVYVMRFMFASDAAHTVSVVGDFNGWAKQATPLVQTGRNGLWVAEVPLPPGRYEYAFIVDGEEWIPDPLGQRRVDDFETESSVVILGPRIS